MTQAAFRQFKSESGFVTSPTSNFGDLTSSRIEVDSLSIDGNSLSAIGINQNINLVTTGTGTVTIDRLSVNTVTASSISTGNISGVLTGNVIGNVTGNIVGNLTGNVTGNITSIGLSNFDNISITGGVINGTSIGSSIASSGSFTTITAASSITGPVGTTTASTGRFTDLTVNTSFFIVASTQSNSTLTGAAVISGGLGLGGNLNSNGNANFIGTVNAAEPITDTNLTTKNYVDAKDTIGIAYAVAFGL